MTGVLSVPSTSKGFGTRSTRNRSYGYGFMLGFPFLDVVFVEGTDAPGKADFVARWKLFQLERSKFCAESVFRTNQ